MECLALFAQMLNDGDLRGAGACFSRDSCFVTQDGTAIHGRDRIRSTLAQLIVAQTKIGIGASNVLVCGEVAWAQQSWTIRSHAVAVDPYEQRTRSTLVLRLIEGNIWKLAIVMPWS
jgi:ketosteroid isomerase-like protein